MHGEDVVGGRVDGDSAGRVGVDQGLMDAGGVVLVKGATVEGDVEIVARECQALRTIERSFKLWQRFHAKVSEIAFALRIMGLNREGSLA